MSGGERRGIPCAQSKNGLGTVSAPTVYRALTRTLGWLWWGSGSVGMGSGSNFLSPFAGASVGKSHLYTGEHPGDRTAAAAAAPEHLAAECVAL